MLTITQLPAQLQRATDRVTALQWRKVLDLDRQMGGHETERLYLAQFAMPNGFAQYNRLVGQLSPCGECVAEIMPLDPLILMRYYAQFVTFDGPHWDYICERHLQLYRISIRASK